ncbi:MAG: hypothetical protein PVF93_00495 [Chromatiaceae bacterium]|jgi:hypothetical protein
MASKLQIIVTGLIAQYPLGGVAWDYLQYVRGLAKLGHDVYYLEDTGQWPFNPKEGGLAKDHTFNVNYLASVMQRIGLADKWLYRFPWQQQWFGLSEGKRRELIAHADLVINVSGTLAKPQEYRCAGKMVYIDSDPVFTQLKLARGQAEFRKLVNQHDVHFSFGECINDTMPDAERRWLPTRQPIVLSEWKNRGVVNDAFTTIMNWTSYKPVSHRGKTYGQKDVEFERFLDLPGRVPDSTLEVAVNTGKTRRTPRKLLGHKGWRVVHPDDVCPDVESYRDYIESSKAEWSIAKNGYVTGHSGWFSCRSACYLAAGKPVVVQDTGFSAVIPCGEGILPFQTMEESVAAIEAVESDYARHSDAARSLASEYFDSRVVLTNLIEDAFGT